MMGKFYLLDQSSCVISSCLSKILGQEILVEIHYRTINDPWCYCLPSLDNQQLLRHKHAYLWYEWCVGHPRNFPSGSLITIYCLCCAVQCTWDKDWWLWSNKIDICAIRNEVRYVKHMESTGNMVYLEVCPFLSSPFSFLDLISSPMPNQCWHSFFHDNLVPFISWNTFLGIMDSCIYSDIYFEFWFPPTSFWTLLVIAVITIYDTQTCHAPLMYQCWHGYAYKVWLQLIANAHRLV